MAHVHLLCTKGAEDVKGVPGEAAQRDPHSAASTGTTGTSATPCTPGTCLAVAMSEEQAPAAGGELGAARTALS